MIEGLRSNRILVDAGCFVRPGCTEGEPQNELYWNVAGNGWGFPIDAASARVELHPGVGTAALTMAGYTGVQGSSETAVSTEIESESSARISSSRPLGVREGLTLVLSFPKGIVEEPTTVDRASRRLSENRALQIALLGFTAMLFYMISIWKRYGRDPEPGTVFPHYEAPSDISPASARHVTRMRYDGTAFTAAVINLAVKGHLNIDESGDEYTLAAVSGSSTPLSTGEHAIVSTLFASEKAVVLDNENHALLQRTMNAHKKALKRENFRTYYVTNSTYLFPALAIVAVTVLGTLIGGRITPAAIAVLVLSAICLPVFGYLLKAPTSIGRRLIDKIEGFRLYLDVAEKDELELKNPPEKTPELFEAFLPYALALGVEQSWGEKFDDVFERVQAQTGTRYAPRWYHGHWSSHGFGSSASSLTTNMTSALGAAIVSAATPPGSSSGAGGGGFSGGGGGGGGGGGW